VDISVISTLFGQQQTSPARAGLSNINMTNSAQIGDVDGQLRPRSSGRQR
jgi:hypothetical protein